MSKRIVVFASGSGSNFQSILQSIQSGALKANVCGLIVSREGIGAIEKAIQNNIPYQVLRNSDFSSTDEFETEMLKTLANWFPDVIVLAGYMKKIPLRVIRKYEGRILNIHPSLLPKYGGKGFFGLNVHQAVIDNKEKVTGCSIHIVTEEYDEGPVLAQSKVDVLPSDTPEILAKRVLLKEHELYPKVIQQFLSSKILIS